MGSEAILGDMRDILAIDQDAAAFNIVKPEQQIYER
jgi:hypothetical protein